MPTTTVAGTLKNMQRQIKFRAWNPKIKGFVEFGPLYGLQSILHIRSDGHWNADSGFTVMEYTGLKDKNGKEIYEGDLLRMKQSAWHYTEHLMRVEWDDEYAVFRAMVIAAYGDTSGTAGVGTPYAMTVASKNGEIIGNIYENPELLA